ncbi:MAG: hypothetical protein ACTSU5_10290 [Promethearchaeota archaeon]
MVTRQTQANSFVKYLNRLKFLVEQAPTKISCKKDFGVVKAAGDAKVGPFRRGKQYSVPFWLATLLAEHGHAEIDKFEFDFGKLQNVTNQENRPAPIERLDDFGMLSFAAWSDHLGNLSRRGLVPPQNAEKYHLFLRDLVTLRLAKLLKLALNPPTESSRRKLSVEELRLLQYLSGIIGAWKSSILGA